MRKLALALSIFVLFFVVGCDGDTTGDFTIPTTNLETSENVETTNEITETELDQRLNAIYQLALESNAFNGTYDEWLESVQGPQGEPGKSINIQISSDYIQWQYVGDTEWINLIELASLVGPAGTDGEDGIDGREVLFQVSSDYIQWQYVGDTEWTNLIELESLVGPAGTDGEDGIDGREVLFQVSSDYIQWQYVGETEWINLIELASLVGPAGTDGEDGIDGREVLFQVSSDYIQWQYVGDTEWTNLIELESLVGPAGTDGEDGIDGREVLFQVSSDYIQWQYVGDTEWINLIELESLVGPAGTDGEDGKSAYEIYMETYPDYTGDENQWLDDLINGNLGTKEMFTVIFNSNGGSDVTSQLVENGSKATKPVEPNREGYTFLGWYNQNEPWVFIGYVVTENITLTAKWQANIYYVTYIDTLNDGYDFQTATYGIENPKPILETDGYTFLGWFTENDIKVVVWEIPQNTTLYAKWSINQYTVTFDSNGGSTISSITQDYGTSIIEPEDPTRDGYIFGGWYTDRELTNRYTFTTMPAEDVTLYAKWTINEYTINYYDAGEAYDSDLTIELNAGETMTSISLGYSNFSAITSEGRVFSWGYNFHGQLGDGTTINRNTPTEITSQFGLDAGEIVKNISIGVEHSIAITSEGRVFSWGSNNNGQLGDGTRTDRTTPTEITSQFGLNAGETVKNISLGVEHSIAITSEGRVFTWGSNNNGQLGDGTRTDRTTPIEITSQFGLDAGETLTSISLGVEHSIAITSEGRVFTWGSNNNGQLGDGTSTDRTTPTEITSQFGLDAGETVTSISLGYFHSSAITSEGRAFTWGSNEGGQLGDGTTTNRTTPTEITSQFKLDAGETVTSISLGFFHSSTITSEGRAFTWGSNWNGQLGDGTFIGRSTPTEITGQFELNAGETVTNISLGDEQSVSITSEGRIFIWGDNDYNQLGDGTTTDRNSPYEIPTVTLYLLHSINQEGDSSIPIYSPTKEGYTFGGWYVDSELTTEFTHTNLPAGDYILYAKWLANIYTMTFVSNGGSLVSSITQEYGTNVLVSMPVREGYTFNGWYTDGELTNEYTFTTMPAEDITLYAKWTINEYTINYYDAGKAYDSDLTIALNAGETVTSISLGSDHSSAITSEGRVFTWGSNNNGQLGDGTTTDRNTPTEITSQFGLNKGEKVISISLGQDHSSAITSEGRVFTWGSNEVGILGDGTWTFRTTPTEITSHFSLLPGETVTNISLGSLHSSAITSEGRVFTWGYNNNGQLGDETTTNRTIPTEITSQFSLLPGETVISISLGSYHSSAITSEGRVFTWGSNEVGQLGDGTTAADGGGVSTPFDITSEFNLNTGETVTSISLGSYHSSAITSEGRVFTWGNNSLGQLGDGTTTNNRNTPTEITSMFELNAGETVTSILLGSNHSSAISSEGRVFTWGSNYQGQLGDGTIGYSSNITPIEITSQFELNVGETMTSISLGGSHSSAITSEGRVLTWGNNYSGQLGDGTTTDRSSPYEIPIVTLNLLLSITQEYDSSIPVFSPTNEGYTFGGWFVDSELTTEFTYTKIPAGDYNLYAKWSLN
ncbi:InlB B-repeat-containing protein [Mycoplasmatota bacterium]|nr:InlB B-repeat-containing protein [Mycoplasmatota bacterium]